jgi:hypothetical protein
LVYNTGTSEIAYNTTKTFVINHPTDESKYLVHSCVEGPDTGLLYRGKSEIPENHNQVCIQIPQYAVKIGTNWSIQLTAIGNNDNSSLSCSELDQTGQFFVYGKETSKFFWNVYGQRELFEVEPSKNEYILVGNAPYLSLKKK